MKNPRYFKRLTLCLIIAMFIQGCVSTTEPKDVAGLLTLARHYHYGMDNSYKAGSHPKDKSKAKELYHKARALGSGKASLQLYYLSPLGSEERKTFLVEAAQKGEKYAIEPLAHNFLYGKGGFAQNIEKGEKWAKIARVPYLTERVSGSGKASFNLYWLNPPGTKLSKELLLEAVQRGYEDAMGELAYKQLKGENGFEQNLEEAESLALRVLETKPKDWMAKRVIQQLPDAKMKKQRAERIKRQKLCNEQKHPVYRESMVGGAKIITMQSKRGGCYTTITATMNKQGKWDGSYKIVSNEDNFIYADGEIKNGVFSGFFYLKRYVSNVHNFYRDTSKTDHVLRTKHTINIDHAMNSGFDKFDYKFSQKNRNKKFTKKLVIKNNKVLASTEYMDDGTVLYEGSIINPTVFLTPDKVYRPNKKYNMIHIEFGDIRRLEGQCLYENKMEYCKHETYVVNNNSTRHKRIDPTGLNRRNHFRTLLDAQIRGISISYNRSVLKWRAEDNKKALETAKSKARIAQDKANRERWAREDAEYEKQIKRDEKQLFNQVFGGSISSSSTNDINDPLNPNNPTNLRIQEQVSRTVSNHQLQQQKAERDYNTQLAQRNKDIAAQKNANIQRRIEQQTPQQVTTNKNEVNTQWDCKNNWRADKCGDRVVTYNIPWNGRAYTDKNDNHSSGDANNQSTNIDSNGSTSTMVNEAPKEPNSSVSSSILNMGKLLSEALAICKPGKSNPNLWWCDGPIQKLVLADDPLMTQLKAVGCGNAQPESRKLAANEGRYVFFCDYGIRVYDRDIAGIYSLPGHILVKRRSYQCLKNQSGKCEILAKP